MKTPLLFLPGLVCDQAAFAGQITALSDVADCSVADYGEVNSIPGMAQSVLAHAPDRFAVAGHSLGGRVAFEILRAAPERVTRAALMDTASHPRPPGEAGEAEAKGRLDLVDLARREGMRAMAVEWVKPMVHPSRLADNALMTAILDMITRKTLDIFFAQQTALMARPDAESVLGTIRCPTLVLCGQDDAWSPPSRHQHIVDRVPGSWLVEIPDCGHMAPMEKPEAVTKALRDWLAT